MRSEKVRVGVVVCEDARYEQGNKVTYVGAVGSIVHARSSSLTFERLCFAVTYHCPLSLAAEATKVSVQIASIGADGTKKILQEHEERSSGFASQARGTAALKDSGVEAMSVGVVVLRNVKVTQPTYFEIEAKTSISSETRIVLWAFPGAKKADL